MDKGNKGTDRAPGQDKEFEITHATTGETRTVTQREWREQQLGRQGWVKPVDEVEEEEVEEGEAPEPEEPTEG